MAAGRVVKSVFGDVRLGYLVVETRRFGDWRRFGVDAVGLHVDSLGPDALRFRIDEHACRFLIQRGPAEDVQAIGWQVDNHESFEQVLGRVTAAGVPVAEGAPEEAALRGVERLWRFPGPKGLVQEIFTRPVTPDSPLEMVTSGFVTGGGGMGHVAFTSKKPHQVRGYYNRVFDARLSDYIDETISGVKLKIRFLRVNERHHSVAVVSAQNVPGDPIRTKVQHVNIQAATLDDMVQSYQRMKQTGFALSLGVGQHTNDLELSYYVETPSGFDLEIGWNPILVDENTWEPTTHQGTSIWGHQPVGQTVFDMLARLKILAQSLSREEEDVPELSGIGIGDN
ncbi:MULTISPECIES: VOC family protein [Nocardia]|uniref:VOC family protein n=1 Tax=Nocardia TaxID=1817 RepID=UPI002455A89F|nr:MULTISPECIES: VOC family protein [Nocardia]